jgi:hypothetical protein
MKEIYISPEGPSWPCSVEVVPHMTANFSSFSSPEKDEIADNNQNTFILKFLILHPKTVI